MLSIFSPNLALRKIYISQRRSLQLSIINLAQQSYYDDLGVHPQSSTKEIKNAFYKLSMEYHPDKNVDNPSALKKFQAISEAYDTLSNPKKRTQYDKGVLGRESSVAEREASSHRFEGETFYGSRLSRQKTTSDSAPSKNLDSWVKDQRKESFETTQLYRRLKKIDKTTGGGGGGGYADISRGKTILEKRGSYQSHDNQRTDKGIWSFMIVVLVVVIVIRSIL